MMRLILCYRRSQPRVRRNSARAMSSRYSARQSTKKIRLLRNEPILSKLSLSGGFSPHIHSAFPTYFSPGSAIRKTAFPMFFPCSISTNPSAAFSIPSVEWNFAFRLPSRIHSVTFSSLSFECCVMFSSKTRKPSHRRRFGTTCPEFLTP
jgi:hypothetical protein